MDQVAFKAPDEDKVEYEVEDAEIEVVDDTPEEDQGRKPAPPPEEVSDDELTQYSESVQKRIKKFSRGYHDERRAKEAALREKEEALKLAQAIVEENKRLKGSLGQNQQILLEQAKKAAETDLEQAKRKYKEAYESGDADAVVNAQEALTSAKMKTERIENYRPRPLQEPENTVQMPQPAPVQADHKAAEWQRKNPWFGSDDEMTAFALGLHQKLVKQGIDPKSDDYYEKINSRMRQVFPDTVEDEDEKPRPKAKANVVAPATRSTAPKKIVLTQSQVNIAKRLGVPLEAYAKQVAEEMRKSNG
jgi:hypothetical protein